MPHIAQHVTKLPAATLNGPPAMRVCSRITNSAGMAILQMLCF